jgi:hypothetical protein
LLIICSTISEARDTPSDVVTLKINGWQEPWIDIPLKGVRLMDLDVR